MLPTINYRPAPTWSCLPTTRLAVMGPAGKGVRLQGRTPQDPRRRSEMIKKGSQERAAAGMSGEDAKRDAEKEAAEWLKTQEGRTQSPL